MPSGDGDVVCGLLDHWERGEFAPGLDHLHPDVQVSSSTRQGGFEGKGGVRRLVGDWDQAFEDWSLRVEDLVDCPDGRRLAVGRVRTRGKKTGTELDRPVALLFTLDDGLIVRIEAFVNRMDEAYAAAGLPREPSS
jgi:ketosteroid isomerase-like protein